MPDGNAALDLPAGDGEAWWFLGRRMTVLVDADRSAGSLTLALRESPAGFDPPHTFLVTDAGRMVQLTTTSRFECMVSEVGTGAAGPGLPPPGPPDIPRLAAAAARQEGSRHRTRNLSMGAPSSG